MSEDNKGGAELRSPREWFGAAAPEGESRAARRTRLAEHNAAAAVHGWREHKHHTGESFRLSRADYDKAIAGANSGLGRKALHRPAMSPECGKGV